MGLHVLLYVWDNHISKALKNHKLKAKELARLEAEQKFINYLNSMDDKARADVIKELNDKSGSKSTTSVLGSTDWSTSR